MYTWRNFPYVLILCVLQFVCTLVSSSANKQGAAVQNMNRICRIVTELLYDDIIRGFIYVPWELRDLEREWIGRKIGCIFLHNFIWNIFWPYTYLVSYATLGTGTRLGLPESLMFSSSLIKTGTYCQILVKFPSPEVLKTHSFMWICKQDVPILVSAFLKDILLQMHQRFF